MDHVAATYDQTNIRVYVNGALATSLALTDPLPNGTEVWRIGRKYDSGNYINGQIDEVRIGTSPEPASEIANNKDCELTGTETGLVAYYPFNQGEGGANNAGETTWTILLKRL